MQIAGLQKLTVLDFPGKVACTLFTPGCNFLCPFCHNGELVFDREKHRIPEEDFFAFLHKRHGLLDGVCISGGEPTLQKDLEDFILRVREMGYQVKLDTNGTRPEVLANLLDEGLLDYVAMDVKSGPKGYSRAAGVLVDLVNVQRSVDMLMAGETPYEFRTTLGRGLHGPEDMTAMGKWLQGASILALQTFVDAGSVIQPGLSAFSPQEMRDMADLVTPYVDQVLVR